MPLPPKKIIKKSFKQVSKRFPSLQSLVSAGLMTEAEAELYQEAEQEVGGDFQVRQCPAASSLSTKSNLSLCSSKLPPTQMFRNRPS